ncbi:nucleotidyltransferase substrate binding protein (TIGR01987 family) [Tamilnaduibacter salinus]|uniref:Nucleotidyltransferase n=1 Tax=Tamilnaduibacter salinus TaxID=1484056 RepID=A0A2A2I8K6_9GAMM|nr:nucleotidyltransferase substrate binding protein [Tamilnaduibacter salinus]PAV27393.1 nucleotidyltransferase [Tamilnaduibacter salinus]PVY75505.1 nucleotidyltransferase substrate binding protein (TIGR01987 family) [Tamilnaduibacter salinus]
MTSSEDIRWQQRLRNFQKALAQLNEAMALADERALSRLEKQGVIQAFEYNYELGWNLLRDYLKWQGLAHITGSRDTIREAFSAGLIEDGEAWMRMLVDRNRTSHTYNEDTADAILAQVRLEYHGLLRTLEMTMLSEEARHGL